MYLLAPAVHKLGGHSAFVSAVQRGVAGVSQHPVAKTIFVFRMYARRTSIDIKKTVLSPQELESFLRGIDSLSHWPAALIQ